MTDPALNQINKKTWNHTKPIMMNCVMAFFCSMWTAVALFLDYDPLFPTLLNVLFIIFAVHSAWLLESKL